MIKHWTVVLNDAVYRLGMLNSQTSILLKIQDEVIGIFLNEIIIIHERDILCR